MEAGRNTVLKLIDAAVQAGAMSAACREFPESLAGLERAYDWHHRRCEAMVSEICHTASLAGPVVAGVPSRKA